MVGIGNESQPQKCFGTKPGQQIDHFLMKTSLLVIVITFFNKTIAKQY